MADRIEVGVLGAGGVVGQHFVAALANHPWFRLAWLGGSSRTAGKRYGDVPWRLASPRPDAAAGMTVEEPTPGATPQLLFSALDASAADELEPAFAAAGHMVISNARSYRMDPVVPLVVPEVNPEHLDLLPLQERARGWRGGIVTNPNCSTVFLAMVLAAWREFEPSRVVVTTLQAASGAGHPGVASLDLLGNVIPFISGEEEKLETETCKILGRVEDGAVRPHPVAISAQTTRVAVVDGHTEALSVEFARRPAQEELRAALERFAGRPQALRLPSAPRNAIVYLDGPDRPQPRIDVERDGGMAVSVGRLRPCPVLHYKAVALGHNLVRGAAGAALLNAELLVAEGKWSGARSAAGARA